MPSMRKILAISSSLIELRASRHFPANSLSRSSNFSSCHRRNAASSGLWSYTIPVLPPPRTALPPGRGMRPSIGTSFPRRLAKLSSAYSPHGLPDISGNFEAMILTSASGVRPDLGDFARSASVSTKKIGHTTGRKNDRTRLIRLHLVPVERTYQKALSGPCGYRRSSPVRA